ncbi:MAG: efflux RND transporter permease subunit [Thiohalocapsa sp.]
MLDRIVEAAVRNRLLVGALWLVPRLGTEFVPELEEGTINIRVTLAPSSSLNTALVVAAKLEPILMAFPELTSTSSRIGRAEIGGDPEPVSNIEIYVGLLPQAEGSTAGTRAELQERMEQAMSAHPGLLFSSSQPIATRVDELLSGVKAQLAIKLFGTDLDGLAEYGKAIETLVKEVPGTRDVALEPIAGESQLVVRPDRDRMARFGIPVAQVMALVEDAIGGTEAGQVIRGNERYDILVRLAPHHRSSVEEIDLPAGYGVVFGGQFENQHRAQQRLMIVVPLSLGLIFLLLYFAFHSVGQALLIMLNVPLALIGGVLALYFSGLYLSVLGSIGFIAVFGIAVLNGVVMVNAINQNLQGGMAAREALLEGTHSRLRPVLMTAMTTVLGLAPLLYATGVGSEVQRPLAAVVVGGLASATFLTLFVVPAMYDLFSRRADLEVGVSPTNQPRG